MIVVIDGVFDRTEHILSAYGGERVRVIARSENWGASRTRNQGLASAETEFVMFVDADDFIEGRLIGGLVESMRRVAADVGFGPMEILYEARGRRAPRFVPDFASPLDIFRKWHLLGRYVNPTSVMWRREFISRIGGWDPEITRNDDGELVMRAVLLGAKIAVSSEGTGVYVKHSSETLNHRLDNLPSLLRVNEKLLAIHSPVLDQESQRKICAGHYLNIAWQCYLGRQDEVGDEALRRGLALEPGEWGAPRYRLPLKLFGVKRTAQAVGWAKQALGRARA